MMPGSVWLMNAGIELIVKLVSLFWIERLMSPIERRPESMRYLAPISSRPSLLLMSWEFDGL